MITGDLDRALATVPGSAGTWRPAPPGDGAARYATSIAFRLASGGPAAPEGGQEGPEPGAGRDPARIAAALAARLDGLGWVAQAEVGGGGYLTVAVTPDALAALAVRITHAGAGCARSDALRGVAAAAPSSPGLAGARDWQDARERLARHLTGRLAQAAGATVTWVEDRERPPPGDLAPGARAVADAVDFAGVSEITFALSRIPPGRRVSIEAAGAAARQVGNPAYAVRYAHAHAASALRQAADLGLDLADSGGFRPRLLAHPRERALLYGLSWLPERVAGAARRGQPDVLARHLEDMAEAYLSCQESCPATWPGMAAPTGTGRPAGVSGRPLIIARLWLAAAARTALAAGLGLLGVDAPDRL